VGTGSSSTGVPRGGEVTRNATADAIIPVKAARRIECQFFIDQLGDNGCCDASIPVYPGMNESQVEVDEFSLEVKMLPLELLEKYPMTRNE
jgi:hypothetical protein